MTGTSAVVASCGSRPAIVCRTTAASTAWRANTPTWSSDDPKATNPYREMRPYVGFKPMTPHSAAGWRTDPPVSDPSATGTIPAATAAADPPEDPPGTRDVSQGFFTGPNAEFSFEEPMANSSQFVFPTTTAPACSSRSITVAL